MNKVYGIDLGTTYSAIACVDDYNRPMVVQNSENQMTTPSVVWFESADNIVVGTTAKEEEKIQPDRVISMIKREIGNDYERVFDGKSWKPQEISAQILRRVVKDAEQQTGDTIKDVVITCPAYFGFNQIEITKQAGQIAGLNVISIIDEPSAAAIAYGMNQTDDQTILVYDLGGGTFDISLIRIENNKIIVKVVDGDHQLGGKDWDLALSNWIAQTFAEKTNMSANDLLNDAEMFHELLLKAENIKVRISNGRSVTERFHYKSESAKIEVLRSDFDELTRPLLERTISLTKNVISAGKSHGIEKIDKLLMVGGSTYMPQVLERISAEFSFDIKQYDPNLAVANGAAIYGQKLALKQAINIKIALLTGQDSDQIDQASIPSDIIDEAVKQVAIDEGIGLGTLKKSIETEPTRVTAKSFGIIVIDIKTGEEIVRNLVKINDPLPQTVTQTFPTLDNNQTEVELRIMQNKQSSQLAKLSQCEPEEPLGSASLVFNRPMPKGSPIEVVFKLEKDGSLKLYGRDLTDGVAVQAEFKSDALMSLDELAKARSKSLAYDISA